MAFPTPFSQGAITAALTEMGTALGLKGSTVWPFLPGPCEYDRVCPSVPDFLTRSGLNSNTCVLTFQCQEQGNLKLQSLLALLSPCPSLRTSSGWTELGTQAGHLPSMHCVPRALLCPILSRDSPPTGSSRACRSGASQTSG